MARYRPAVRDIADRNNDAGPFRAHFAVAVHKVSRTNARRAVVR